MGWLLNNEVNGISGEKNGIKNIDFKIEND